MENNNLKPSKKDEIQYASGAGNPAPDVSNSRVEEQPTRPEMSMLDREELPTRPEMPTVNREELDNQPTQPEVEKVTAEPDVSEVDTKHVAVYEQPTMSQSLHDMREETIHASGNAVALSGQ